MGEDKYIEARYRLIALYNVCVRMRAKQKEYFKTRDKGVLQESKKLEKGLDELLKGCACYFQRTKEDSEERA